MGDILQGLYEAGRLIVTLDADLLEISLRSLYVTLTAVAIAALIGLPTVSYTHLTLPTILLV